MHGKNVHKNGPKRGIIGETSRPVGNVGKCQTGHRNGPFPRRHSK